MNSWSGNSRMVWVLGRQMILVGVQCKETEALTLHRSAAEVVSLADIVKSPL